MHLCTIWKSITMLFCSLIARSNSQDGRGCASTRWSINVCFKFSVNLLHVLCVLCGWYLLTCFSNICTFCALIWWSLLPLKAFLMNACTRKPASGHWTAVHILKQRVSGYMLANCLVPVVLNDIVTSELVRIPAWAFSLLPEADGAIADVIKMLMLAKHAVHLPSSIFWL